ncbi:unnamed protein product [Pleuronectes platessa]|uniref:Uncharacterized protein n=1 Tax=Pleuronectes platessa TaxID=8262 RepID=A0A9N7TQK6_PLEPL|nr:unnamed protein product [Pleuronectes platessa]
MTTGLANTNFIRHRRRPPPPRERRVPLTGAVAEVIREKSPTHVQSRCRRPSYPVPSNRSRPSAAPTDTAPRHTIRKAPAPRTSTSPPKKTSRSAAHRASGGVVRRATGRLLPQPQDVPSGLTTNTEIVTQVFHEELLRALRQLTDLHGGVRSKMEAFLLPGSRASSGKSDRSVPVLNVIGVWEQPTAPRLGEGLGQRVLPTATEREEGRGDG